jgi:methyl-accepting chemotaxis protein
LGEDGRDAAFMRRFDLLKVLGEKLSRMSIRLVLGQIIGLLGIFLVVLCAMGLSGAIERDAAARRTAALASISQQLFSTLLGFRLERGTVVPSLIAEQPADKAAADRIAANRSLSEEAYLAAMKRLAVVRDDNLRSIIERFSVAHDALAALRVKADDAIAQPKPKRDVSVVQDYPKAAQAYLDSILATSSALEASLKLVDPVVDQLLMVKQSAWAARNYGGLVAARIEAAAGKRAWAPADITSAAEDTGRAAQAWSQIKEAAARPDAPPTIVVAADRVRQPEAVALIGRQQEVIKALSNGQTVETPVIELQKLNTASLSYGVDVANASLAEMVARAEQQMSNATWRLVSNGLMMLVALLISGAGLVTVQRRVSTPIRKLTEAMRRLADHDLTVVLEGTARGDEIGDMSRAVEVFKESMIKADQLTAEQQTEHSRRERRRTAIEQLIKAFDASVTESLQTLATASTELEVTAQSMSSTAEQTSNKSVAVAAASEQASANVQTVAAATEELTASITEISRQVAESTGVASDAVAQAERTNAEMQALADAAQRIGDVVKLISGIAEQTNLLALNATIEAARAGEAGKGFAVVAAEVKNLATQTARATEEITAQVSGIQGATGSSVQAIQTIASTITCVNQIASAIAAAVEEQGAATREIARNVQQASMGTTQVSSHIASVSQAAGETGAAAGDVLNSVKVLVRLSDALPKDVDAFVNNIRAA